jgi:hypothetical protein
MAHAGRVGRSVTRLIAIAAACALVALVPAASAQDFGDVLGTTIINDTLTQIGAPQVPVPNPDGTTEGGTTQPQASPEQPKSSPQPAHALGWYCKGESKRHVRGQKRTPFSQCVSAMGRLQSGKSKTARGACLPLSHKKFPGMKQTPFAVCVSGGKKLLADLGR